MTEMTKLLRAETSDNHRRVISVRMRLLEESCLRLLDLFRAVDMAFTSRLPLPREKAAEVERLVQEVRTRISQIKSDLALARAHADARREASAMVTAMNVNLEELRPRFLKGYGRVPDSLARYLETQIDDLMGVTERIHQILNTTVKQVKPAS
jgi:hypothetical protein